MAKTLNGKVVSVKMQGAVVVEVTRRVPHPKYKKLLKRSKKFKAVVNDQVVGVGDVVTITETRPLSKDIHFAVSSVVTTKGAKSATVADKK
jgi:small subunit ribosomal protein S17